MIIVPASVCGGVRRRWRALLVSQSGRVFIVRGGVLRGEGQLMVTIQVFQSLWAVCSLDAGWSPVCSWWFEVLFDDLRTVAPGFGLSFGQSEPGRLCGNLRRVTGGEAL